MPIVTTSREYVHVFIPGLAITMHIDARRRESSITYRGVLLRKQRFAVA